MPRKPKENYYQLNGRPNAGFENPERFGLTFSEVARLVESGKWRNFYKSFMRRERRTKRIEELNFVCPSCGEYKEKHSLWNARGDACRACERNRIKEVCVNCCRERKNYVKIGIFFLCNSCYERLKANNERAIEAIISEGEISRERVTSLFGEDSPSDGSKSGDG